MKRLYRHQFQAWLEHQRDLSGPQTVVGQTCSPRYCPLAIFMEGNGSIVPVVTHRQRADQDGTFTLPKWAQLFTVLVDCSHNRVIGRQVTAGEALNLLAQC